MATSGEKRWPPVGNFVAASGEKPMAIDTGLSDISGFERVLGAMRDALDGHRRAHVRAGVRLF
jgi:hypothetical protein